MCRRWSDEWSRAVAAAPREPVLSCSLNLFQQKYRNGYFGHRLIIEQEASRHRGASGIAPAICHKNRWYCVTVMTRPATNYMAFVTARMKRSRVNNLTQLIRLANTSLSSHTRNGCLVTPSTPVIDTCKHQGESGGLRARLLTLCYIVLDILVYFFAERFPKLSKLKVLFPFFSWGLQSRRVQKYGMPLCLIPIF